MNQDVKEKLQISEQDLEQEMKRYCGRIITNLQTKLREKTYIVMWGLT